MSRRTPQGVLYIVGGMGMVVGSFDSAFIMWLGLVYVGLGSLACWVQRPKGSTS